MRGQCTRGRLQDLTVCLDSWLVSSLKFPTRPSPSPTLFEILYKIYQFQSTSISRFNDYCPTALMSIIMKCFEKLVWNHINSHLPPGHDSQQSPLCPTWGTRGNALSSSLQTVLPSRLVSHLTPWDYLKPWIEDFLTVHPPRMGVSHHTSTALKLSTSPKRAVNKWTSQTLCCVLWALPKRLVMGKVPGAKIRLNWIAVSRFMLDGCLHKLKNVRVFAFYMIKFLVFIKWHDIIFCIY